MSDAVDADADAVDTTRDDGDARGTAALIVGTIVGGIFSYVFLSMGAQRVGAEAFSTVSVLWTMWLVAVALLSFPLQQWIVRTIRAEGGEATLRDSGRSLVIITVVLSVATFAFSAIVREQLFRSSSLLYPLIAASVPIGSAAVGVSRGVLVGRGRLVAAGISLGLEGVLRVVVSAALATTLEPGTAYEIGFVAGFAVVALWPSVFVLGRGADHAVRERRSLTSVLAFLADIAGATVMAQWVLAGGPIVLRVSGGLDQQVTALFVALTLFRAPFQLATGVSAQITKVLTGWIVDRDERALRRVRFGVRAGAPVMFVAGGLFGAAVGPPIVSLLFGSESSLPTAVLGVVVGGSAVALVSLLATLLLVATGQGRALAFAWIAATAVFALGFVPLGDATMRVALCFVAAQLVAIAWMAVVERSDRAGIAARVELSP